MLVKVFNILNTYFNGKSIRSLRDDEKLPRGFKFLSSSNRTGIVSYYGTKYYYSINKNVLEIERLNK